MVIIIIIITSNCYYQKLWLLGNGNSMWQNLGTRDGFDGFWLQFRGRRNTMYKEQKLEATYK